VNWVGKKVSEFAYEEAGCTSEVPPASSEVLLRRKIVRHLSGSDGYSWIIESTGSSPWLLKSLTLSGSFDILQYWTIIETMTAKPSNFSIPVCRGGAPGRTGGKMKSGMVATTLKELNLGKMELQIPKNKNVISNYTKTKQAGKIISSSYPVFP